MLFDRYWAQRIEAARVRNTLLSEDNTTYYDDNVSQDLALHGYNMAKVVCEDTMPDTIAELRESQLWDTNRPNFSSKRPLLQIISKALPQPCWTRSAATVQQRYFEVDKVGRYLIDQEARVQVALRFLAGKRSHLDANPRDDRDLRERIGKMSKNYQVGRAAKVVMYWVVCSFLGNWRHSSPRKQRLHPLIRKKIYALVHNCIDKAHNLLREGLHVLCTWAVRDFLCFVILDEPVFRYHLGFMFRVNDFIRTTQAAWDAFRPIIHRAAAQAVEDNDPNMLDTLFRTSLDKLKVVNAKYHKEVLKNKYQRSLPPLIDVCGSFNPLRNKWVETDGDEEDDDYDESDEEDDYMSSFARLTPDKMATLPHYIIPPHVDELHSHKARSTTLSWSERFQTVLKRFHLDKLPDETPEQRVDPMHPLDRRVVWCMYYWIQRYPTWFTPTQVCTVLLPGLLFFGASRLAVWHILDLCKERDIFRIGREGFGKCMKRFISRFPFEFRLLRTFCILWRRHTRLKSRNLHAEILNQQLQAVQQRFRVPVADVMPLRECCLDLCPSCLDILSMLPKGVSRQRFTADSGGTNGAIVDVLENALFCSRTSKIGCQLYRLFRFPLLGRQLIVRGKMYMLCPQPGCGRPMILYEHRAFFNEHGPGCGFCEKTITATKHRQLFQEAIDLDVKGRPYCFMCNVYVTERKKAWCIRFGTILCERHYSTNLMNFLGEKHIDTKEQQHRGIIEFFELLKEQWYQVNKARMQRQLNTSRRRTRGHM